MNRADSTYYKTTLNAIPCGTLVGTNSTGKERDEETGYGYFGARYMDHELTAMWLSVDPMADKYPGISPYAYCAWNPVKLVDPDGMECVDRDGRTIKDHSKIRVYIFYDPSDKGFEAQSLKMYDAAIKKYGQGSVALSKANTEKEFSQDWGDMSGKSIKEVNLNYHGSSQALHLDYRKDQYITSTENGKTNLKGTDALNISDLPTPKGNINGAQLNVNSCHSNQHENLKGSGKTLMEEFRANFTFNIVRGTSHCVCYNRVSGMPHAGHNYLPVPWEFMFSYTTNRNYGDVQYYRSGGVK